MSTSLSATIMEFLNNIFGSEEARAEFLEDPEGYLSANNLDDLSCADFDDALVSFFENAEFENEKGDNNLGGNFTNTVAHDGQSDHEAIAEHLTKIVHEYGDTYITNNDNDVVNDASFNGTIISDGDVTFDNDITSASGDGAVAAGDDINGDVVTGDGSFIGDGNQVGDHSAFGDGANSGTQTADNGGAISNAGNNATSTGSADDNSVENEDSFNTDNSVENEDSFNTDNSTDDDVDVDVELQDSLNDNSDRSTEFETETNTEINNTNDDGIQTNL